MEERVKNRKVNKRLEKIQKVDCKIQQRCITMRHTIYMITL